MYRGPGEVNDHLDNSWVASDDVIQFKHLGSIEEKREEEEKEEEEEEKEEVEEEAKEEEVEEEEEEEEGEREEDVLVYVIQAD